MPPGAAIIRKASPEDVGELLGLVRCCVRGMREAGIDQWDDVYPDEQTIRDDVVAGTAHVSVDDEGIAGMVVLNEQQDPTYVAVPWQYVGRVGVVHRLMVRPAQEGRGVGRDLLRFAEQRAMEVGYDCIRLDAFPKNPRAIRLYERAGYRLAGHVEMRKGMFDCFEKDLRMANNAMQRTRDEAGGDGSSKVASR